MNGNGALVLKGRARDVVVGEVEIARSFAYKLNAGNYESRDFFCSQKAACAPENAEQVSEALYLFCKREVMKAVSEYIAGPKEKTK